MTFPSRPTDAAEIAHYDSAARSDASRRALAQWIGEASRTVEEQGNLPLEAWLHSAFDSTAQREAMHHVLPLISGRHFLQIGGVGVTALKALLAGATSATLVTPSRGELDVTRFVSEEFGLAPRFTTMCNFAEDLPLPSASIDVVVSEASMHHTQFVTALSEIHRVLVPGGRFACFEPWRAPLYGLGTRVFGKRDRGVKCRPLDRDRVNGIADAFPSATIHWHGALTRYPLIVAGKFGVSVPRSRVERITRLDDRIASAIPGLRRRGSSVSIVGTKA